MKESHGDWLAVEHGSELGQGEINNYVSTYFNIIYFPEYFKLKDSLHLCFSPLVKAVCSRNFIGIPSKFLSEFAKQIKRLQNSKGIVMSSVNDERKNSR